MAKLSGLASGTTASPLLRLRSPQANFGGLQGGLHGHGAGCGTGFVSTAGTKYIALVKSVWSPNCSQKR